MLVQALFSLIPLLSILVSAVPTARQNAVQLVSNCQNRGQVALTYDDGPSPLGLEYDILKSLDSVGAKATFFLNGNNWGCIYNRAQTLRDLHAQGHTLASHTWAHADLTLLNETQLHSEFERVETAFIKILGLKPVYFRPPYGNYNDLVLSVASQRGYKKMFMWSHDSGDSTGGTLEEQKGVYDTIAASFPTPALLLQHSVHQSAVNTTEYGAPVLRNAGYQMVSVDTCMGNTEWPYVYVGEPQQPDASWVC